MLAFFFFFNLFEAHMWAQTMFSEYCDFYVKPGLWERQ